MNVTNIAALSKSQAARENCVGLVRRNLGEDERPSPPDCRMSGRIRTIRFCKEA